jgi:pentatricopeptide repeat protein
VSVFIIIVYTSIAPIIHTSYTKEEGEKMIVYYYYNTNNKNNNNIQTKVSSKNHGSISTAVWVAGFLVSMISRSSYVQAFLFLLRSTTTNKKCVPPFKRQHHHKPLVLLPPLLLKSSSCRYYRINGGYEDNRDRINNDDDNNNDNDTDKLTMSSKTVDTSSFEHRLTTLLFTIKNQRVATHRNNNNNTKITKQHSSSRLPSSCWAFIKLLQQPKTVEEQEATTDKSNTTNTLLLQTTIQALRFAGDVNDYRYIMTLMDTIVLYYSNNRNNQQSLLIDTRLFGEAIRSLSQTAAGPSKLRQMWKKMLHATEMKITSRPPSAFELNTMIAALGQQGKVLAAIELYHTYADNNNQQQEEQGPKVHIPPDSYTYSALFDLLSNSITSNTNATTFTSTTTNITNITTHHDTTKQQINSSAYPSFISTPYWQWKKTLQLLDSAAASTKASSLLLNNFVYTAALKVNEKAAALSYYHHDGATAASDILRHMETIGNVRPDVVTCTKILSALEQGKRWKDALSLLHTMNKNTSFPLPNAFSYTCVISACAQSGKTKEALALLDELRDTHINSISNRSSNANTSSLINTWVYNSALAAYNTKKRTKKSLVRNQKDIIESFIDRMESDAARFGFPCAPDTATYNIALSCISRVAVSMTKNHDDNNNGRDDQYLLTSIQKLLLRMKANNISRDSITYKTAILCCLCHSSSPSSEENLNYAMSLWEEALHDLFTPHSSSTNSKNYDDANMMLTLMKVANAVLEVCAQNAAASSVDAVMHIMNQMIQRNIPLDSTSVFMLLRSLGRNSSEYKTFPLWMDALRGDDNTMAISTILLRYKTLSSNLLAQLRKHYPLQEYHYASMLTWCIHHNDLKRCMKILKKMKLDGVQPSVYTYESMVLALSKSAILLTSNLKTKASLNEHINQRALLDNALSRAKASKKLLSKIPTPSFNVLSAVCRACTSSGLWSESIAVLRIVHRTFLFIVSDSSRNNYNINRELAKLHRSLLSICARYGNAKAALEVVDTIQELEGNITLSKHTSDNYIDDEGLSSSIARTHIIMQNETLKEGTRQRKQKQYLNIEDYKLLMIAASKEKNWQVCLTTLQALRPYIEARGLNSSDLSRRLLTNRDKDNLEFALTSAVLCLEANGHYAWSIRVIHDWIEWSRLKPKKEALIATCRLIANSDKSRQVLDLLSHVRIWCTNDQSMNDKNYFRDVYSQAIGSLHRNGDFASADELYCTAVEEGLLPWVIVEPPQNHPSTESRNEAPLTLDLHGMTSSIAQSAVRVALQRELFRTPSWLNCSTDDDMHSRRRDVIIVTGRGVNSADRFQPILRPQVQQMLTEEFYPPLSSSSLKGNMGALLVPAEDVNAWLLFHKQQRENHMLALANIIRNISSGNRLVQSLKRLAN